MNNVDVVTMFGPQSGTRPGCWRALLSWWISLLSGTWRVTFRRGIKTGRLDKWVRERRTSKETRWEENKTIERKSERWRREEGRGYQWHWSFYYICFIRGNRVSPAGREAISQPLPFDTPSTDSHTRDVREGEIQTCVSLWKRKCEISMCEREGL